MLHACAAEQRQTLTRCGQRGRTGHARPRADLHSRARTTCRRSYPGLARGLSYASNPRCAPGVRRGHHSH
eukprot:scaffold44_cov411-Prasinococcus_capsulatus_cf.AAC.19